MFKINRNKEIISESKTIIKLIILTLTLTTSSILMFKLYIHLNQEDKITSKKINNMLLGNSPRRTVINVKEYEWLGN